MVVPPPLTRRREPACPARATPQAVVMRSLVLRFASGVEQSREVDQVPLAERKLHRLAA